MKRVKKIISEKIVSDPIQGIIDIRPVLPLIGYNRDFESLNYKYQLGLSHLIFPSATHTRRAHSFGSYKATVRSTTRLKELGMIKEIESRTLRAFALFHDIGHSAFSHITEVLCPSNHKERGLKIAQSMRARAEQAGIDFKLFVSLFKHENPLHLIVSDKNLGTEKLDYLARDGFYTILGRPPGIEYLQRHIYFIENDLVIDEKAVDNASDIQDFYVKMYKGVYLRKASVIAQRMMQKITYQAILEKELTPNKLVKLNDFELLSLFSRSNDDTVKYFFNLLMKRSLFKEAVVIKYKNFTLAEKTDKPVKFFGVESDVMDKIANSPKLEERNQKSLKELENKIAKIAGLKNADVLAVPVISPDRFKTKDIKILTSGYRISSLEKEYPAHFLDIQETAKDYAAFRICTQHQYREKISKKGEEIKELILDHLK